MTKIAIVYHSGYGHTAKVAQAVAEGAKAANGGSQVDVIPADSISDGDWSKLDAADAIIFGSPTYMGSASAPFKAFMDATSGRWMHQKWKNKIAAGFTNSGSLSGDKMVTLQQLITLSMQHGMIWVGQAEAGPQPKGMEVAGSDQINRVGSYSGLMTQSNNEGSDIAPPSGDLETAKRFGARVVEVTKRFSK